MDASSLRVAGFRVVLAVEKGRRMDRVTILQGRLVVWVLAAALALAVAVVVPRASSAAPVPADDEFTAEGMCDFPVLVEITGKENFIDLPGESFLLTFPGQRATLTNLDEPDNQVTFGIQGAGGVTPLANGDVLVVSYGRSLLFDPGEGISLVIGKARFTVASGPGVGGDIAILESNGRLIDVCARLT